MAGRCAQGWHGESKRRSQHGAALLIFLVLLVMAGLTYVINSFSPEALQARRAKLNDEAFRQAQEALLGYALKFREEQLKDGQNAQAYGYLPLPDLGSSRNNNPGCAQ
jgi:Tfp pilus assembly protein PilX